MVINKRSLKGIWTLSPAFIRNWYSLVQFKRSIPAAFKLFLTENERNDSKLLRSLRNDMIACRKKFRIQANEYFLFGFRGKSDEYRASFLPDEIKDSVLQRFVSIKQMDKELKDKYYFYQMTSRWFGRDVMLVDGGGKTNLKEFKSFALKHPDIFIKNNYLSKGRGSGAYHVSNVQEAEELYSKLLKAGGKWIVEERIVQSDEMAQWNVSSVNTVRIPAILHNDKWSVIGPFFRTGRKGAIVDNAAAGGVFACVDAETGILSSEGIDEAGVYYAKHPDSGLSFKGWQIPQWKELLAVAERVQRSMPHHKYVGWDFALTNQGWILIEGNWGQFISQYNNHIGLKKQFFELLGIL